LPGAPAAQGLLFGTPAHVLIVAVRVFSPLALSFVGTPIPCLSHFQKNISVFLGHGLCRETDRTLRSPNDNRSNSLFENQSSDSKRYGERSADA
jgi:hypothetical protein